MLVKGDSFAGKRLSFSCSLFNAYLMINHRGIQNGAGEAGKSRCKIGVDLSSLLKEVLGL